MTLKALLRGLPSPVYRGLKRLHLALRPPPVLGMPPSPGPLLTDLAPYPAGLQPGPEPA
jgi:hypothetical protein